MPYSPWQMARVIDAVTIGIFLLLVYAGTCVRAQIGNLQWTSGGMRVAMQTIYAAWPKDRALVVAGFGNCAVQMPDSWTRHLDQGDPSPTGSCDTWPVDQVAGPNGLAKYFGPSSLQPSYQDYPGLASAQQLYGFDQLASTPSGHNDLAATNRLYLVPGPYGSAKAFANWTFSGDPSLTQVYQTTALPLQVTLDTSYAKLESCARYGGGPVLAVTNSGGRTTYTFGVYLLTVQRDPANPTQVTTSCSQRQFVHSVGSSVTATWGGFNPSNPDGTVTGTVALGVRAEFVLHLLLDPAQAPAFVQDPLVLQSLEMQLLKVLTDLAAEYWAIDLEVEVGAVASGRRSTLVGYNVPFVATYTLANNQAATSDVATMGAVFRHLVETAFSNTPGFKADFMQQWMAAYLALAQGNQAWPLASAQLANPPFSLLKLETLTTDPPAQVTPTAAPTGQPTRPAGQEAADGDDGLDTYVWLFIGVGCAVVLAGVLAIIGYYNNWCRSSDKSPPPYGQKYKPVDSSEIRLDYNPNFTIE